MHATITSASCILAVDTATGPCSVAVWKDGSIASYREERGPVMQSASLVPMIEDALRESGITYGQLDALAATIGPGSFTGIRVALAAARAICFAQKIPCMGYTSLQVLAFSAPKDGRPVLAALTAGKGEHYYQYSGGEPKLGLLQDALQETSAKDIWLAGNAKAEDARFTPTGVTFPQADWLARLASTHPELAQHELRPFYIRPPDAKLPKANTL